MVEQPAATFMLASLLPELLVIVLVAGLGVLLALAVRATMRHWADDAANSAPSPMSREDISRLEALVAEARSLIDELDRRSAGMQDLLQRLGGSQSPEHQPASSPSPRGRSLVAGQRSVAPHPAAAEADPATQKIYGLADEGLDAVKIAQRLGEQVGKVQLILALRPR
jgi:hypothetical protein